MGACVPHMVVVTVGRLCLLLVPPEQMLLAELCLAADLQQNLLRRNTVLLNSDFIMSVWSRVASWLDSLGDAEGVAGLGNKWQQLVSRRGVRNVVIWLCG